MLEQSSQRPGEKASLHHPGRGDRRPDAPGVDPRARAPPQRYTQVDLLILRRERYLAKLMAASVVGRHVSRFEAATFAWARQTGGRSPNNQLSERTCSESATSHRSACQPADLLRHPRVRCTAANVASRYTLAPALMAQGDADQAKWAPLQCRALERPGAQCLVDPGPRRS